jgi:cytochrome d ubiquinol oxidase subunit I
LGICGFYLWRGQFLEFARTGLSIALWMALLLVPAQLVLGDCHGRNSFEHQAIKVAAVAGDWESRHGQHLVLFAWPDMAEARNLYEVAIPNLGSLILTHSWDGWVPGLKSAPRGEWPPVPIVFFAFRAMAGIWIVLFVLTVIGTYRHWRGRLYDTRWFSFACAFSSPLPFLALLSGWTVTETGRQPYPIYGHLRTADATSPVATSVRWHCSRSSTRSCSLPFSSMLPAQCFGARMCKQDHRADNTVVRRRSLALMAKPRCEMLYRLPGACTGGNQPSAAL